MLLNVSQPIYQLIYSICCLPINPLNWLIFILFYFWILLHSLIVYKLDNFFVWPTNLLCTNSDVYVCIAVLSHIILYLYHHSKCNKYPLYTITILPIHYHFMDCISFMFNLHLYLDWAFHGIRLLEVKPTLFNWVPLKHFPFVLLKGVNLNMWDLILREKSNWLHLHNKCLFDDRFPILNYSFYSCIKSIRPLDFRYLHISYSSLWII